MPKGRQGKRPRYPRLLVFDENLKGVATALADASARLPQIGVALEGASDHELATSIDETVVFLTADLEWLRRQPPHKHGGIIVLDTGNLSLGEKAALVADFLWGFHQKNKSLDVLRGRRYRITKTAMFQVWVDGREHRLF
jgi:hypothetical protein